MNNHRFWLVATALGCAAHSAAAAQQSATCPETITVGTCFTSGVPELAAGMTELNEKPTGSLEAGGANPTAIADYLPRFAAALLAPGVGTDASALSFSTNLRLNDGTLFDLGATLQAAVTVHDPEVFAVMLDSLPESLREGVSTRLENGFNELSDVQLTLSLNRESRRYGRSIRPHADEISRVLNGIAFAAYASAPDDDREKADSVLRALATDFPRHIRGEMAANPDCRGNAISRIRLDCFEPDYRARLQTAIQNAAAQFRAEHLAIRNRIAAAGVSRIADLLNNQPQLSLTFEARPREVAAGPTTFALRFRGEWSPANLNGARRYCRRTSSTGDGQLREDCLAGYLNNPAVLGSLRRADRLWFTLDVTRQDRYRAPLLPEDSAVFLLPSSWTVEPALGFGWYLTPGEAGAQRSRFDLQVNGSFQQSQSVRTPSRVLASATYSLRMGDNVVGTAGMVWANRPEFLGDDVRRIGARFGVRYKLPGGQ